MNPDNQLPPPIPLPPRYPSDASPVSVSPKGSKVTSFIKWLIVLIVIAAAAYGGYYYGHHTKKSPPVNTLPATVSSSPTTSGVHFVQSIGFPYDQSASKDQFVSKLGLPSFLQGVRISSTIQNQGAEQIFTNYFNNELGRWEIGNPTNPEENGGGVSELSLLAITSSWLAATGQTDFTAYGYGSAMETPAQKQQYMSSLQSSTAACVKDPTKGFKTKDGNLDVCYTYTYGKESYGPEIQISGYGDIASQPVILVGFIQIYDNTIGSDQTDQLQAISNAANGHPDAATASQQKAIIAALTQTSMTASPNPN